MQNQFRISDFGFRIHAKNQNPQSAICNLQSRGFTLIELLVVIIVLGVLVGLVIPTMGEMTGANLRKSSRHLTGMIRFLRDDAQAKKAVYRLRFDIPAGHYWAEFRDEAGGIVEFKRLQTSLSSETGLAGQTTFRDVRAASHPDDPYIEFRPDGWVERAAIHLKSGDGKDYTLLVKPLTGETELLEGTVEER